MSDEQNEQPLTGWHLRKEVNLAHIISTLLIVAGLMSWGHKMDLRLTRAEDRIAAQEQVDSNQNREIAQNFTSLERSIEKIDTKMESLMKFLVEKRTHP